MASLQLIERSRTVSDFDVFLADCPARTTLDLIGNTWMAVTLFALGERPRTYTELGVRIGGISNKMLTQTLRKLRSNGLVESSAGRRYALTVLGRSLLPAITVLVEWAEEHAADIVSASEAHGAGSIDVGGEQIERTA